MCKRFQIPTEENNSQSSEHLTELRSGKFRSFSKNSEKPHGEGVSGDPGLTIACRRGKNTSLGTLEKWPQKKAQARM